MTRSARSRREWLTALLATLTSASSLAAAPADWQEGTSSAAGSPPTNVLPGTVQPSTAPPASGTSTSGTSASGAASSSAAASSKKKREELKKKVASAYKDPFFMNDFSYLNDPNYQGYNLGEAFKQIPIGPGKVDFGGQYRLRYHGEHNMRGLGLTGRDDDFLLDRTRLYMDYRATERIRLFAEMLDAGSSYENFAPRLIEENQADMQNLFADVVAIDSDAGKLTLRGGRQELLFGGQRLLSPLDWANTRRTFEGGRASWSNEDSTTDFLLVRPVTIKPKKFDSPNQDQVLYGVYNSRKESVLGPLDIYYLGFDDDKVFQRVHTIGTLLKGEKDNWLWDNEFGYQFGRNPDASDISAFSLTFGGGRKLDRSWKPTLWMYYDWASGDDSINNGWNQLFPLGHRYLGFMDFFARRNIHDINSILTVAPSERLTLLSWYHYLALANGNQGPYNVTGTAFNPGGTVGSRDLGHELDLLATYKVNPRSDLVLGYSHFFSGKYYSRSLTSTGAPLFNGDADFFYTQWHYNF